ncbi:hypothetical protein K469DRAFT_464187, partial [Zopfia rhizophila CBS 207.26]
RTVTVCSPGSFEYSKSLRASAVFDYRSPTCGADICTYTNNSLYHCFDTRPIKSSADICVDTLFSHSSTDKSKPFHAGFQGLVVEIKRENIGIETTLSYRGLSEAIRIGEIEISAIPEHKAFVARWIGIAEHLTMEGELRLHTFEVRDEGLQGALGRLEEMRKGGIRGKKLI